MQRLEKEKLKHRQYEVQDKIREVKTMRKQVKKMDEKQHCIKHQNRRPSRCHPGPLGNKSNLLLGECKKYCCDLFHHVLCIYSL